MKTYQKLKTIKTAVNSCFRQKLKTVTAVFRNTVFEILYNEPIHIQSSLFKASTNSQIKSK